MLSGNEAWSLSNNWLVTCDYAYCAFFQEAFDSGLSNQWLMVKVQHYTSSITGDLETHLFDDYLRRTEGSFECAVQHKMCKSEKNEWFFMQISAVSNLFESQSVRTNQDGVGILVIIIWWGNHKLSLVSSRWFFNNLRSYKWLLMSRELADCYLNYNIGIIDCIIMTVFCNALKEVHQKLLYNYCYSHSDYCSVTSKGLARLVYPLTSRQRLSKNHVADSLHDVQFFSRESGNEVSSCSSNKFNYFYKISFLKCTENVGNRDCASDPSKKSHSSGI